MCCRLCIVFSFSSMTICRPNLSASSFKGALRGKLLEVTFELIGEGCEEVPVSSHSTGIAGYSAIIREITAPPSSLFLSLPLKAEVDIPTFLQKSTIDIPLSIR